ncbi:MAG: AAA family ATPase [Candidatus Nomurabacteria bacterium]|nr:AAA family ATPase [Candidatus Nomurabacteria bacterium]
MRLKSLELLGFKSFAKKTPLEFESAITAVVGPNGSGKSNVVESLRFVLGEQSIKSMRGKAGVDLIFKGSKTLPKASRASVNIYFDNKDKVFKLENETGEKINLNYDTINISREVFSDGLNKYSLNGSEVRLKDIVTLLSSVNIGSSGHHIISQGEADRILNASSKERREMIEDALGLKIYQYKIKESERKLDRTATNMKEVSLLRKEIAPHLNFLRKQVEKLEKAKEQKIELLDLYREYLQRESKYLTEQNNSFIEEKSKISNELESLSEKIKQIEDISVVIENPKVSEIKNLEKKIYEIRSLKGEIDRKLGRIEGMIEMEERRLQQTPKEKKHESVILSFKEAEDFVTEMNTYIDDAMTKSEVSEVFPILNRIKESLKRFSPAELSENNFNASIHVVEDNSSAKIELERLQKTREEILVELHKMQEEEDKVKSVVENLKSEIEKENFENQESQKTRFDLSVRKQELLSGLSTIAMKEENFVRLSTSFEDQIREGSIFLGGDILSYKNFEITNVEPRENQLERLKKIERIKIKLEDAGLGGGTEVLKEYEETSERDIFLAKEMEDLSTSIVALRSLMMDLKEKIDIEFKSGIQKINKEFQEFFALMFGGGSAFLTVIAQQKKNKDEDMESSNDENIVFEHGIEISVSLPHKKVKELQALSGGERSLTSIALLFAISQVNPPPFLVLDETDAALDEANSRKYGDMLEKLSKHSQLIVVTHNRETMSRAGVLYGVTVGSDGASKLLSVKFEEAVAIAK